MTTFSSFYLTTSIVEILISFVIYLSICLRKILGICAVLGSLPKKVIITRKLWSTLQTSKPTLNWRTQIRSKKISNRHPDRAQGYSNHKRIKARLKLQISLNHSLLEFSICPKGHSPHRIKKCIQTWIKIDLVWTIKKSSICKQSWSAALSSNTYLFKHATSQHKDFSLKHAF